MSTNVEIATESQLNAKDLSRATNSAYTSTLEKWKNWGNGIPIEELLRKDIRSFLDWVFEHAVDHDGTNPGRTTNKAREHLRAVMSGPASRDHQRHVRVPHERNPERVAWVQ